MKNSLVISGTSEDLVSSINDGTNGLFINDVEIASSYWVGSGTYETVVNGQTVRIEKIADTDGNVILVKIYDYYYVLKKSTNGGGGNVNSYNDLTDKPQIEGVTLIGNKTYEELNLQRITNSEIEDLLS